MRLFFPGQQSDEEIKVVVREHWFFFILRFALWLIFVAILFATDHYLPQFLPGLAEKPYSNYFSIAKNIYLLFLMLGIYTLWIIYYLNIWIITDKRVVDVTQPSIFNQKVSVLILTKVEDITSSTNGILGTLLSYGDVSIQTAGEKENFVFKNVQHPKDVERLVFNMMEKHQLPQDEES